MAKHTATNDSIVARVTNFLTRELVKNEDVAIFKNPNGTYDLFNRFIIAEAQTGNFTVWIKTETDKKEFSSLKNAVSWCILINRQKPDKAKRVEQLDEMLGGVEVAISLHKHMIKRSKKMEDTLIYLAKLSEEQAKKTYMVKELLSHVNSSKYLQTQRFSKGRNKNTMINNR